MKMSENDYTIRSVSSNGELKAMAHFSGMSMKWPTEIYDNKTGKTFRFASNEPMEDWMVGNYSGFAKYILID
jgi:hypothetical protein